MVAGDPVDLNLTMSPSLRKIPALLTKNSAQPCQIESYGEIMSIRVRPIDDDDENGMNQVKLNQKSVMYEERKMQINLEINLQRSEAPAPVACIFLQSSRPSSAPAKYEWNQSLFSTMHFERAFLMRVWSSQSAKIKQRREIAFKTALN